MNRLVNIRNCGLCAGPSNRSNSVSSLDLEVESVSEGGPGPSGSNGAEALQLLEHEQGTFCVLHHCFRLQQQIKQRRVECSFVNILVCALCSYHSGQFGR